jgi:hypothetical protein
MSEAWKTVDLINDKSSKDIAIYSIAESQLTAGDISGALKSYNLILDKGNLMSEGLQSDISKSQNGSGNISILSIYDWTSLLDEDNKGLIHRRPALNTEPFLNLATYLKSLPTYEDTFKTFMQLNSVVGDIIDAQNKIERMLKQQALHKDTP